jgi:hypothetical protein
MLTPVFRLLSVRTLKNPSKFSSIENERKIQRIFNDCQTIRNRPGTIENARHSSVNWFNWGTFWTFVLNCDVTTNKNSAVFKLGTRVLNISNSWWGNCYVIKVLVFVSDLSVELRIRYFDTYVCMDFYLCFDVKNCSSLFTCFRYTL